MAVYDKQAGSHVVTINTTETMKDKIDGTYKLMVYLQD